MEEFSSSFLSSRTIKLKVSGKTCSKLKLIRFALVGSLLQKKTKLAREIVAPTQLLHAKRQAMDHRRSNSSNIDWNEI